ncbi:hypothetical protein LENED_000033 [Lentinula edodes]|uniref:Uncharacterized protein n=1 Tax=Lentinula edodes TaxID=5353 RepID=A0A1Q3DUH0_LENED|nr:hypothetical protein LENED_000033 [Lentinula edodes]
MTQSIIYLNRQFTNPSQYIISISFDCFRNQSNINDIGDWFWNTVKHNQHAHYFYRFDKLYPAKHNTFSNHAI